MANGLFLITYLYVKGGFAIIKLDQNSVREISEIRYVARNELCLLHGARAAHNATNNDQKNVNIARLNRGTTLTASGASVFATNGRSENARLAGLGRKGE